MEIMHRDLISFPPKKKLRDKLFWGQRMRDLDSAFGMAKSLKRIHQTQIVSYGSPSCVRSCRDIPLDPKNLVEECDTALKVRQSARDIVVSHRNRPTVKYATLAKEAGL